MFVQDYGKDFDTAIAAILNDRPFALSRFHEGEYGILTGRKIRVGRDDWSHEGDSDLRRELYASLIADMEGYCVGLPCYCCDDLWRWKVWDSRGTAVTPYYRSVVKTPLKRQTFQTLFGYGNYAKFRKIDLVKAGCFLAAPWDKADFFVPRDAVKRHIAGDPAFALDDLVDAVVAAERPALIAAGPLGKVIVHRVWQRTRRHPVVDVGSSLEHLCSPGETRRFYAAAGSRQSKHRCDWQREPDAWMLRKDD